MLLLLCSELTQHTPCYEALTTQAVRACFLTLPLNASAYKISQYYQTKLRFTENPVKTVSTAVKHTELQEYDNKLRNSRLAQKSKRNKSNKNLSPSYMPVLSFQERNRNRLRVRSNIKVRVETPGRVHLSGVDIVVDLEGPAVRCCPLCVRRALSRLHVNSAKRC